LHRDIESADIMFGMIPAGSVLHHSHPSVLLEPDNAANGLLPAASLQVVQVMKSSHRWKVCLFSSGQSLTAFFSLLHP